MKKILLGILIGGIGIFSLSYAIFSPNYFSDVSGNSWYSYSVNRLFDKYIMNGNQNSSGLTVFRPADTVTRAEMAVTINRLLNYVETKFDTLREGYSINEFTFYNSQGAFTNMKREARQRLTANQEIIESFNAPVDPTNPARVYFSTSKISQATPNNSLNTIYSYDLFTGTTTKIYETQMTGTSAFDAQILRTVGIDGNKLVMLQEGIDNSPGVCYSIWNRSVSFKYLDITNTQAGLQAYVLPQSKVNEGQLISSLCAERLDEGAF